MLLRILLDRIYKEVVIIITKLLHSAQFKLRSLQKLNYCRKLLGMINAENFFCAHCAKKGKGGGVIHEMSSVKFLRFIIALSLNFVSENFLF